MGYALSLVPTSGQQHATQKASGQTHTKPSPWRLVHRSHLLALWGIADRPQSPAETHCT